MEGADKEHGLRLKLKAAHPVRPWRNPGPPKPAQAAALQRWSGETPTSAARLHFSSAPREC